MTTKSKKHFIRSIVSIALLIALCFTFAGCGKSDEQNGEKNGEQSAESSAGVSGDFTQLEFYPVIECSEDDLSEMKTIMEARVKVLGDNYEISSDDKKITLKINKDLLGTTAVERSHTVDLIKSRGDFAITTTYSDSVGYSSSEMTKDSIKEMTVEESSKSDFLSAYLTQMTDERYAQLSDASGDTIYYLNVTLSADGEEAFSEEVENAKKYDWQLCAAHDLGASSDENGEYLASLITASSDDASGFYLVSPGATYQKNAELMKEVIAGDTFDCSFVTEIADAPTWETKTELLSENQVTEMSGKTVVIEATPNDFTLSYNSEIEFEKYKSMVKERLAKLGTDFMFGVKGFDEKTFCVKIAPDTIAPDFARLIFGEKSLDINSPFRTLVSPGELTIVEDDGKLAISTTTYKTKEELITEYSLSGSESFALEDGATTDGTGEDQTVYLVVNDVTVASANLSEMEGDTIIFKNFLAFGDREATEDDRAVLELICSIYENDYISFDGTYQIKYYEDDATVDKKIKDMGWKYPALTAVDEATMATIEGMGHSVEKAVDVRNMLLITLDVEINSDLPTNFTEELKEVYNACNFDDGSYNKVIFAVKDEKKESPANKFRFEFSKEGYSRQGMVCNDYVSGPQFSDYWMEVYSMTNEDEFFTSRSYF